MPKIPNLGSFAPKPYLKVVDPDFLVDGKISLLKILKRVFPNIEKCEYHYNGKKWPKHCKQQNKHTKS